MVICSLLFFLFSQSLFHSLWVSFQRVNVGENNVVVLFYFIFPLHINSVLMKILELFLFGGEVPFFWIFQKYEECQPTKRFLRIHQQVDVLSL